MSTYIPEYFPDPDCIAKYNGGKIENVLAAVASRFIGAYPRSLRCTGYIRRVVSTGSATAVTT